MWLHAKAEGMPVVLDLAEKNAAFEIMASTMSENGYDYSPVQDHEDADNDDHKSPEE